jgi:hypothetical protein
MSESESESGSDGGGDEGSDAERSRDSDDELSPLEDFVNLRDLREKGELGRFEGYFRQFEAGNGRKKKRTGGSQSSSQEADGTVTGASQRSKYSKKRFGKGRYSQGSQKGRRKYKSKSQSIRSMKAPK